MEIIDTHVHYWEPPSAERPWDPEGRHLGESLLVEDLLAASARAGVTKIVQVVPQTMGYDNRYGFECAEKYPEKIAGVFVRFDPVGADLEKRLDTVCRERTFLGVRLTLVKPPFSTWLTDGTLDPFFSAAAKRDFPVAVYAPHLAIEAAAAARRNPNTRFLLDHMTLRYSDEEPFAWWGDILALADVPNVWIKVTSFPQMARDEPYPFPSVQARYKELVERFGADRLMWGSNYPPVQKWATYEQCVDFTKKECSFLSETDKETIFAKTFLNVIKR